MCGVCASVSAAAGTGAHFEEALRDAVGAGIQAEDDASEGQGADVPTRKRRSVLHAVIASAFSE